MGKFEYLLFCASGLDQINCVFSGHRPNQKCRTVLCCDLILCFKGEGGRKTCCVGCTHTRTRVRTLSGQKVVSDLTRDS